MDLDLSSDKEYAVVCFSVNGSYSEVPASWVIRDEKNYGYKCWWPDDEKNIVNQIKQKAQVAESGWSLFDVTVDKLCSTYKTAHKRALDAKFESSEEVEEPRDKRHRTKQSRPFPDEDIRDNAKRTKTDSNIVVSSESEEELSVPAVPQAAFDAFMGNNSSKKKSSKKSVESAKVDEITFTSNASRPGSIGITFPSNATRPGSSGITFPSNATRPGSSGIPLPSNLTTSGLSGEDDDINGQEVTIKHPPTDFTVQSFSGTSNDEVKEMFQKLTRMWAGVDVQQKSIIERLDKLEKKNVTPSLHDLEVLRAFLPVKRITDVEELNEKLKLDEFKSIFVKHILQIGGSTARDVVYNVLAKVIKDKCARKYTWKGKLEKPAANNLPFIVCIRENICATNVTLTEADFNTYAKEWFRIANQRYNREKEKKRKSLTAGTVNAA